MHPPKQLCNGCVELKYEIWYEYGFFWTTKYPVKTITFTRCPGDTTNYNKVVQDVVSGLQREWELEELANALDASFTIAVEAEIYLLFRAAGHMIDNPPLGPDFRPPPGGPPPDCPSPLRPPASRVPKPVIPEHPLAV